MAMVDKVTRAVQKALGATPTVADVTAEIAAHEATLQRLREQKEEREQAYTLTPDEAILDSLLRLDKQITLEDRRTPALAQKLLAARVEDAYNAYDTLQARREANTQLDRELDAQIAALDAQRDPVLQKSDTVKRQRRADEHETAWFVSQVPEDIRPLIQGARLKEIEVKHGLAQPAELDSLLRHEAEIAALQGAR